MRKQILIFLVILWGCLNTAPLNAAQNYSGYDDERVGAFYEDLLPYGEWIEHSTYGMVWHPFDIEIDWRPYSNDGEWVYTEDGWMWESAYPWGWVCFHYGRWFFDKEYGWLWYPDTVWAPAWVVWREGDDWIGWAPLPPEAIWEPDNGLEFADYEVDRFVPAFAFSFCRVHDFYGRDVSHRIVLFARNVSIFKYTNVRHNVFKNFNGRVVCQLPFEDRIENAAGRHFHRARIVDVDSPHRRGHTGDEARVFRPDRHRKEGRSWRDEQNPRVTIVPAQPSGSEVTSPSRPQSRERKRSNEHRRESPSGTLSNKEWQHIEWKRPNDDRRDQENPTVISTPAPVSVTEERPTRQDKSEPDRREIKALHQNEERAVEKVHASRQRELKEEHTLELQNPPAEVSKKELIDQQKAEIKALKQEENQEHKIIRTWQGREDKQEVKGTESSKRPFKFSKDNKKESNDEGEGEQENQDSDRRVGGRGQRDRE